MVAVIQSHYLLICFVLLIVTSQGISKSVQEILDDDIRQFHKNTQPKDSGFEEFAVTQLIEKGFGDGEIPFVSASVHRRKRSLEKSKQKLSVEFKAFNETFTIDVQHQKSVIHPNAKVILTNGEKENEWFGPHPDCFLTGNVTSHTTGTVSLSYCHDMEGSMWAMDHEYHIMTLPRHLHKRDTSSGITHSVLVSRRHIGNIPSYSLNLQKDSIEIKEESSYRTKRNTYVIPSTSFTMELAVYTDADFTSLFTYSDVSRRINAIATKYNGVQAEWGRVADLGYTVTIDIKYINMFEVDPIWYNVSTTLGANLQQICQGAATSEHDPYDIVFLHTGVSGANLGGLAYQNKICSNNHKCGVSASRSLLTYIATAHEIGHNIGMYHDDAKGCVSPNVGVMGGHGIGWSTCSRDDMQTFLESGNGQCLWETNIPLANVSAEIQSISLTGELIGQTLLQDEVCEILYGSGFRFREYPNFDNCGLFSCVDMNRGTTFGQMYKEGSGIAGNYCGEGMVCFKASCVTLAVAELTGATVTAGGWSDWGSWTTCSRTCGTGMLHRRRICNNPRPKNHATCSGDEYEAELCNTTPCSGDSSDEGTLKSARATETCERLLQYGIISSTNYLAVGTVFSSIRMGKCEVKCDTQPGYTAPAYTRYGLMPDGSPCNEALHQWDEDDWPRRPGYEDYCLEGYCQVFGCDNKLNGQQYDQCGVCGGDNSTCLFYNSVFADAVASGVRVTIVQLPAGSFNIQFWFTYSQMGDNYVELWNKYNRAVIASRVVYSWVFDTGSSPIYHAGVFWSFYFNTQYLIGRGILTDTVTIKYNAHGSNPNLGVNYAYSTPLNVGSCTGTCQNGGTWDSSVCACICPSNYYSLDCSTSCQTECRNGGTVIEDTCGCQCNNQSFGDVCETCKVPYTGQSCQSCVGATCQNCGVFDSATCRCQCLDGYGGTSCEKTCEDSRATCADDAAAGKCVTDNINMEADCPLSCGLCVAKVPPDTCSTTTQAVTTTTPQPSTTTCAADEFKCTNSVCVSLNVTCDDVDDCGDNSDELGTCMSSTGTRCEKNEYMVMVYGVLLIMTIINDNWLYHTSVAFLFISLCYNRFHLVWKLFFLFHLDDLAQPSTTSTVTPSLSTVTPTTTTTSDSTRGITTTRSIVTTSPSTTVVSSISTVSKNQSVTPTSNTPSSTIASTTNTFSTPTTKTSITPSANTTIASSTTPTPTEDPDIGAKPLTTEEIYIIVGTIAGFVVLVLGASGYALYINRSDPTLRREKGLSGTARPYVIQEKLAKEGYHEYVRSVSIESHGGRDYFSNGRQLQSGYNVYPKDDILKNYDYIYSG
ncbi:A disintegrin and metalloproteinase with thrombospondin motifs 16-like [Ylistrum balloti]|uniref:A disintegrin and metalloproteinase with thrombospondin motifs 16-like n=1 Tax=Ylistrum balloti TaxID=509963 RepID=UPI002905B725|nr:A disintegrin and metalloproteinase with thrombospondin motifs 16-like [Ylistrum balloti]